MAVAGVVCGEFCFLRVLGLEVHGFAAGGGGARLGVGIWIGQVKTRAVFAVEGAKGNFDYDRAVAEMRFWDDVVEVALFRRGGGFVGSFWLRGQGNWWTGRFILRCLPWRGIGGGISWNFGKALAS